MSHGRQEEEKHCTMWPCPGGHKIYNSGINFFFAIVTILNLEAIVLIQNNNMKLAMELKH